MDNKNKGKLNSKDLEKNALELLNRAANGEKVSQSLKKEKENTKVNKPAPVKVKVKQPVNENTSDSEKEQNGKDDLPKAIIKSDETSTDKNKDAEDKIDINKDEEIKELISEAMENMKKPANKNSDTPHKNKKRKAAPCNANAKNAPRPKKKKKPTASNGKNSKNRKNSKKKKGTLANKKVKITVSIIAILFVVIIGVIVGLFFHYSHMLDRKGDSSKVYESMPVDSSDITSGADTFNKVIREQQLREQLAKKSKNISNQNVFNVLLIGEDVRDPKESGRGNTDVMMIISINKQNKTITLTSLLRDAWVYLDEFGTSNKLNAAFWHGGSKYLGKVIQQYYGITIDRYACVNFDSFIDIVKAVGGLDFNVKSNEAEAMKDPLDEVNDILGKPHGTGYIKAGKRHLDGYQSLAYARIRYNCGDDYGRTQRQRAVISQIIKKSKKLSLVQLDALLNKVLKKVKTDVTDGEIASMLLSAFDYMTYDVQQLQIPANNYFTNDKIDGLDVLTPNFDANTAILEKVIYGKCKNAAQAGKEYEKEKAAGLY